MSADGARAETGVLLRGPWRAELEPVVRARWAEARFEPLTDGLMRIDLSATTSPAGARLGFEDAQLLALLSATSPGALVFGYYCDAAAQREGVRLFSGGIPREERQVAWAEAQPPDPIAWPIGVLSLTLGLAVEQITSVVRPPRPPLAVAVEGLLAGERPSEPTLVHQALDLLGQLPYDEATAALVRHLAAEDWVERFHAARAYARLPRRHGQEGRPRLEALMDDADESVREALLHGISELLPEVAFADRDLQAQIDAAIARGLEDEDEDVREAAGEARAKRRELLG